MPVVESSIIFETDLNIRQKTLTRPFTAYPGHRMIVIATNVAETSITIPGIR